MKHIWVVENSGGRKWRPSSQRIATSLPMVYFTKTRAKYFMDRAEECSPGLKWRVAKYTRSEK
jgi:hypothetical protein